MNGISFIGYSGHAFVAYDALFSQGLRVQYYCDQEEKLWNPYKLRYLGNENSESVLLQLAQLDYFIGVGNNKIRSTIQKNLEAKLDKLPINAIHSSAIISPSVQIGHGVLISSSVNLNAQATIGNGVICNTACIIEHECKIKDYVHIAPGAVLAGNVLVGQYTFIGANAVVLQGVSIGKEVTIGAGAVIINDIPDGVTVVGNPGRIIKPNK